MTRTQRVDHINADVVLATNNLAAGIIAEGIYSWIRHNTIKNTNLRDGRYWTYISVEHFRKFYPYLTTQVIRTALKRLEECNIIDSIRPDKDKKQTTIWYALTDYGFSFFSPIDGEKIVDKKKKQKAEEKVEIDEEFEKFCNAFKKAWNENLPKNHIKVLGAERTRKLKSIVELEVKASGEEREDVFAKLIILIDYIAENEWLCNKISYDKGITIDWLINQSNYTKLVEGQFSGGKNFEDWLDS